MHYTILKEYEGKTVDVYTVRNTHTGILKLDVPRHLVVLAPVNEWTGKRYGSFVIDADHITAIREVKPRPVSEKDEGEDDCNDCDESKG